MVVVYLWEKVFGHQLLKIWNKQSVKGLRTTLITPPCAKILPYTFYINFKPFNLSRFLCFYLVFKYVRFQVIPSVYYLFFHSVLFNYISDLSFLLCNNMRFNCGSICLAANKSCKSIFIDWEDPFIIKS